MEKIKLLGPFRQLLTLDKLPVKGALQDSQLEIIEDAGMLVKGDFILEINTYTNLLLTAEKESYLIEELVGDYVAMPGFIDPHTHICWAGNRAEEYALKLSGKSYIEIAKAGGGIWNTVTSTRNNFKNELTKKTVERAEKMLNQGITTIEVKSGYGLSVEEELKILEAIKQADKRTVSDLIPTCLAAHTMPKDFKGNSKEYLDLLIKELLPQVYEKGLANRVDIFIEKSAFNPSEALDFLLKAQSMGFEITVHADQFTTGGSKTAIEADAVSADHLEASGEKEIKALAESAVISVALPGSSLGLGAPFTPARKLLDAGACLAIGSDWNPGSAPMGDLLTQAAILGIYERLSTAEVFAGITFRAALALNLKDRGVLKEGYLADVVAFKTDNYTNILYNQGQLKPNAVWKNGVSVKSLN
ncbi:MAG: imidazolonepropionase [Bacteroidales bacterium]|nr:imidazolonepropionase [Bacteroidales bacterium]MBN2818376.1 imidazolonepropionase [Bacteroidales bacterium]